MLVWKSLSPQSGWVLEAQFLGLVAQSSVLRLGLTLTQCHRWGNRGSEQALREGHMVCQQRDPEHLADQGAEWGHCRGTPAMGTGPHAVGARQIA